MKTNSPKIAHPFPFEQIAQALALMAIVGLIAAIFYPAFAKG